MRTRTFVIFSLFALFFAVAIPVWAISKDGAESESPADVPERFEEGKRLFVTNCGSCHTMAKAGTDGVVGPDLDVRLADDAPDGAAQRTLSAIQTGLNNGAMPAGIIRGDDAKEVAEFVGACKGDAEECQADGEEPTTEPATGTNPSGGP